MPRIRPLDAGLAALVVGAVVVVAVSRNGDGTPAPVTPPSASSTTVTATPLPSDPGPTAPQLAAPTFAVGVPGPVEADCVVVGDRPRLRSGQFVVADLQRYRRVWTSDRAADKTLFVTPLHLPPDDTGLALTATRVRGGPRTVVRSVGDPSAYVRAPGYFTLATTLPTPGRWELRLTSGADRGCFLLDLPLPASASPTASPSVDATASP